MSIPLQTEMNSRLSRSVYYTFNSRAIVSVCVKGPRRDLQSTTHVSKMLTCVNKVGSLTVVRTPKLLSPSVFHNMVQLTQSRT
jgi:hypothetical protein